MAHMVINAEGYSRTGESNGDREHASFSRSRSEGTRGSTSLSSSLRGRKNSLSRPSSAKQLKIFNGKKGKKFQTPNLIDLKSISHEEIEWEGYLYKQRKIVKNWTPRYITLQNRVITVYKSKAHAIGREQHRGQWELEHFENSLPSAGFGGSKLDSDRLGFSFIATNGHTIHFIATNALEKSMWMHMMQTSLEEPTSSNGPLLHQGKAGSAPKPRSLIPDYVGMESSISKHFADKFVQDLISLMRRNGQDDSQTIQEDMPSFLRQLSKDCEIWFDLETTEEQAPCCVFNGKYHGREGFVHFMALYSTKYQLAVDSGEEGEHSADDDDHHNYAFRQYQMMNTVTNSTTAGKLSFYLVFTPARRVSRVYVFFRRRGQSQRSQRVISSPMLVSQHPNVFHSVFLTKRALALSFSDFDVVGVLGQGGFGTVVLVKRHLSPDELFAIKIIDKHSGAESALKERRILSGVRHPFLACLRFAFQTQTKLYLGLDYYKGGNLYLHMHSAKMDPNVSTSSGRRFSIERARFYAAELAIALSYLHAHGIIYRDLKPDNIMLDRTGHIRLVDFGISKQLTPEAGSFQPTGTLAGSPAYIAPEQLITQKPQYGMEADWWSYGVLLYEMLTGTTPFFDMNVSQMYKKIQTADVKYDRKPPIDEQGVDLLQKLLVRDPTERAGIEQVKEHPFFEPIDWAKLELKDVEAPWIPPANELMENVHEHFRNMNVEETVGDHPRASSGRRANTVSNTSSQSHFDEFSFAFDTSRDSFDGVSMADDGWLMEQLREGAAMRGRLQEGVEDGDLSTLQEPPSDSSALSLKALDSQSSDENLSDENDKKGN